jgi:hypothetical protein
MAIRVSLSDMENIWMSLVERMRKDGIEDVDIDDDYYWLVSTDEWANFESTPNCVVGSLHDDWAELQKVVRRQQIPTYLDLERFASVLRSLSEKIAPTSTGSV